MRLIKDFSQYDSQKLIECLISYKKAIWGFPLIFGIFPWIFMSIFWSTKFWKVAIVLSISIPVILGLVAVSHSRIVQELEKRLK